MTDLQHELAELREMIRRLSVQVRQAVSDTRAAERTVQRMLRRPSTASSECDLCCARITPDHSTRIEMSRRATAVVCDECVRDGVPLHVWDWAMQCSVPPRPDSSLEDIMLDGWQDLTSEWAWVAVSCPDVTPQLDSMAAARFLERGHR